MDLWSVYSVYYSFYVHHQIKANNTTSELIAETLTNHNMARNNVCKGRNPSRLFVDLTLKKER